MSSATNSDRTLNQAEMSSRRSTRSVAKDLPDDDAASTSSTGSTGQVSYRETPVRIFKRKTGGRKTSSRASSRAGSVNGDSPEVLTSEPLHKDRYPSVSASVLTASSVLRSPMVRSSTTTSLSSSQHYSRQEAPGFSSGYSSSEEAYYRPTTTTSISPATSSLQSPAEPEFDLKDALRSPAQALVMVYWWLGAAWYSLTSGITYLDVFLLSRRTASVRKAILLFLLFLLLAFGLWYSYPLLSRSLSRAPVKSTPVQPKPSQPIVHQGVPAASLTALKEEIYRHMREHEARLTEHTARGLDTMKQEIVLLKEDEQKRKQATEVLQSDIQILHDEREKMTSAQAEQQSLLDHEIAGVQQQLSQLRSELSGLRTASDSLQSRIASQEAAQAQAALQLREDLASWLLEKLSSHQQQQQQQPPPLAPAALPPPAPAPAPLPEDVVLEPRLQGALEALEQRLLSRLAEERQRETPGDAWRTVGETLQREGVGAATVQDVEQIVHRALSLYRADGIGMADYALESSGASVINTRCSETYRTRSACLSLFGFPLWYHSESPRTVIQPELYPGKCWAFRGAEGFLVIALSYPTRITHVTLEHVPRVLSPTGHIDSAPRKFAVYGMANEHEEGAPLGTFTYDQSGEPIQTFRLPAQVQEAYRMVELRILSNWGHPEYTCVYRFRVHGDAQVA
ncbi:SUN domain-containing protein 2-like isoform X2 [Engraulis encrasicolus]|uniref:SUN domain-containing protein 2-like isoform X2 n=1 Tax=Engraulis encrasicolus TaxID=184585 RepID=UPI002FD08D73